VKPGDFTNSRSACATSSQSDRIAPPPNALQLETSTLDTGAHATPSY
jgi:hypothetical protein